MEGPERVDAVDSVILFVEHLGASITFYRDVIGLPFRFQDQGYAEFATEGTKFALYERSGLPELIGRHAAHDGPAGEVLFLVDDVDAEAERIRGLGARIISGPADRPWGHRTLHVLDPDGFVVELAQEIPRQRPRDR